jgi:hypothetical protein
MFAPQHDKSILFITLDSCRYDTFRDSEAPNLKAVGPLHKAMAPGTFTFSSHSAMFVGFTPGVASSQEPFVNPKYGKIFRIAGPSFRGRERAFVTLEGRNIIDGLRRAGYLTIGTGAVDWFNNQTEAGRLLSADFEHFYYPGGADALSRQLHWLSQRLAEASQQTFVFLNIGETHVPYHHEGAPWPHRAPCVPFSSVNDAEECRRRQRLCVEYVDRQLAPLLDAFASANILVCADHGDCWGEDGLWEHGFHHPKVLEVPLLFRLNTA